MLVRTVVLVWFCFGVTVVEMSSFTNSTFDPWISTSLPPGSHVSEGISKDGPGDKRSMRPIDKGLQPLYVLANGLLDSVQPETKSDWIDDPRFNQVFNDGDINAGIKVIYESFGDWQFWTRHYVGFTACAVIGILFVIVMPIVGLCLCICRCRGRCGARVNKDSKKADGCKMLVYGVILVALTTLITAGMVCAFVTNELVHEQTSSEKVDSSKRDDVAGFLPAIVESLWRIEAYSNRTYSELKDGILSRTEDQISLVNQQLSNFPDQARDRLATLTNSDRILSTALALASSLEEIGSTLGLVRNYLDSLLQFQDQLNGSLSESKANLLRQFPDNCQLDENCKQLKNQIDSLSVVINFSEGPALSSDLRNVQSMIDKEFRQRIDNGRMQYQNMSQKILDDVRQTIRDKVNDFQGGFNMQIIEFLAGGKRAVDQFFSEAGFSGKVDRVNTYITGAVIPKAKEYGSYRYYIGIGLSCVLLLVVVCTYLGLCFGACGETAEDDARACNRGVGASFLMAGVGFAFIFFWLLMIVVIVLFVVGGASYTEVCRPVLRQQNKAMVKVAERILDAELSKTGLNLTILALISNCENNKGLYTAMNLEPIVNLTGQFDTLRSTMRDVVTSLRDEMRPNLSSVVIVTDDVRKGLYELKNADVTRIPFSKFDSLLNQPITNANVSQLASKLDETSRDPRLNRTQQQAFHLESQRLRNISSTIIEPMINISSGLKDVLKILKSEIVTSPGSVTFVNRTDDLITALNDMQTFIQFNLSELIHDYISNFVWGICNTSTVFVNEIQYEMQNNVGKCRVLYDEYTAITVSVCQSFLNPFNGFWFSFGWCLFFSIPGIIFSVCLVGLYRKSDPSTPDSKSLDDPFPQALRSFPPPHHQGHQNPVYNGSTEDNHRLPDVTGNRTSLTMDIGDPGFVHPLYLAHINGIRPGHRNPQRYSTSSK